MVAKKQEHLLKAMTEQGIGSWSLSRCGGQRQAKPGTKKLKANLVLGAGGDGNKKQRF